MRLIGTGQLDHREAPQRNAFPLARLAHHARGKHRLMSLLGNPRHGAASASLPPLGITAQSVLLCPVLLLRNEPEAAR
jgi:hypothetical protein